MKTTNRIYSFFIVCVLLFSFYTPSLLSADPAEIVTQTVAYDQNRKEMSGFIARPKDNCKHAALILIHECWGLNENIKENAPQFTKAGYVALAVDLYTGRVATTR